MTPIDEHKRFLQAGRLSTRLARLFARLDLPDRIDLDDERPILFTGNHRSLFDVFVTLAVFTKFDLSSRILIRADLVDSGMTGTVLRRLGSIPTSRANRVEAENEAVRALERGHLVSMMPEGRLVPPAERAEVGVGPGRTGLSRIARRGGAVVVPVAIVGTDVVWPRGGMPRLRRSAPTVRVRLGDPIELPGDDDRANTDLVMGRLAKLVRATEAIGVAEGT